MIFLQKKTTKNQGLLIKSVSEMKSTPRTPTKTKLISAIFLQTPTVKEAHHTVATWACPHLTVTKSPECTVSEFS